MMADMTNEVDSALDGTGAPTPAPRKNDPETLARQIVEKLTYAVGKTPAEARRYDWLEATTLVIRDRIIDQLSLIPHSEPTTPY